MVKSNKSVCLLTIVLLILSNIAFAPSHPEFDEHYDEDPGMFNDDSFEDFKGRMEEFRNNDIDEKERYRILKEKFGDRFSQEQFSRMMQESDSRMSRKESFSYEHRGFEPRYYAGPSYDGYSRDQMIFGMVFEHIGDEIDPREIKEYCKEPEKIVEIVLSKLEEKAVDLQQICGKLEEQEAKCSASSKTMCLRIGTPMVREYPSDMEKINSIAYSCPANKEAILEACKLRSAYYTGQRIKNSGESCAERFNFEGERLMNECRRFKESQICEKDKFIEQCMGNFRVNKENFDESGRRKQICSSHPAPNCHEGSKLITKTDANSCIYYYCEPNRLPCPSILCAEGDIRDPSNECPKAIEPACSSGTILEKSTDERGCIYYHCKKIECPKISKPTCNSDETLQANYDNSGCVSNYQCTKNERQCPQVSKPECTEDQSMTTKYDDKGCIIGYECISVTATGNLILMTGNVVMSSQEDYTRECDSRWVRQEKFCMNNPNVCDKESFVEKCKEKERMNSVDLALRAEGHCSDVSAELRAAQDRCSRLEQERDRCAQENEKRCSQMNGMALKCKEILTEENFRKYILDEAKKRCRFTDIVEYEDDIRNAENVEIILAVLNTAYASDLDKLKLFVSDLKEYLKLQDTTVYRGMINPSSFSDVKLLPFVVNAKINTITNSKKAQKAASKLVSLRDSDLPSEYIYIIEDKANDVLNVSDKLEEIQDKDEQKGVGYKIKLFLGLARQSEKEEINQLEESKIKLNDSIETLTKLINEIPNDVAKAILKEQVENLKSQHEDIEVLIETKEKKAKGWFGVFG